MKPLNLPFSAKTALLLFSLLTITSCTERIETDLAEQADPRLVVEGWITDQAKAHHVRLTMSGGYMSGQPAQGASGAQVTINDGQQTFPLTEQPVGSGDYYTMPEVAGEPGRNYTLTINTGGQTYTASDMMRPVAPIDAMSFELDEDEEIEEGELPLYKVRIWTQELPGGGDHYRWITYVNGVAQSDSLKNATFTDDLMFEGADVNGVTIDEVRANPGDEVRVEQLSISGAAYDVIEAILQQTEWRGGLFDPPPANVPSNISNGALGFFGAASLKERSGTIPN